MASHSLPENLSPDAIDTLTELSQILTRLRAAQSSGAGIAGLSSLPALTGSGATPSASVAAPVTGTTPLPSTAANTTAGGGAAISLKDIPTATDNLKHKLQKARAQIKTLPDMSRTLTDQEAEIRELEERIRRQREVLDRLREVGIQFGADESGGRDKMEM